MGKLIKYYLLNNGKLDIFSIKFLEYIIGVLYCLAISYFITLIFSSNILFHTDTFAPIEEIKLLINVKDMNFNQLHLARIPSLLPDLALIFILIKFFKFTEIFTIISAYSIISSFLLLLLSSFIVSILIEKRFSFLLSSFFISTFSLFLIKSSSFYRDALSHYLTPLHQGGNIFMTLLCVILLFSLISLRKKVFLFNIFLFYLIPAIIGVSLTSNKLFLFTFLLPIFLSFVFLEIVLTKKIKFKSVDKEIYNLLGKPKKSLNNFVHLLISQMKLHFAGIINNEKHRIIVFVSIPILIFTFSLQYFLDLQCIDPITFKFHKPIEELYELFLIYKTLAIFFLANIILILYSIYSLYKNIESEKDIFSNQNNKSTLVINTSLLGCFFGLSSVSPLFYIWITNNVISRYLLVLPLLMPVSIYLFTNLISLNINLNSYNTNKTRFFNLIFIGLFTLLFVYSLKTNFSFNLNKTNLLKPNYIFYRAALMQKSDYARDYEQISSLGLDNGLSDFWGSSVSYFGEKQINVSPILTNGTPNLWAHNINYFFNQVNGEIRDYDFVYSRNKDFSKSIIDIYGNPNEIYQIESEGIIPTRLINMDWNSDSHFIFIYNNEEFKNKLVMLFKDRSSFGCRNY